MIELNNPASGELIETFQMDDFEGLEKKLEILRQGQKTWRKKQVKERVKCVARFGELLKKNQEKLARDLTLEVGKPLSESHGEVSGAIDKLGFFIEESENLLSSKTVKKDGGVEEIMGFDPLGVITNISAWNYPYLVGINIFIPALITGNAVMYKPSEQALLTGRNIAELLYEAGIPENVFQLAIGDGKIGQMLCEQDFDGYFFTGSVATGRKINQAVAAKMVPVGLEMGGKDPMYICDDVASIKDAADNAIGGIFYNNGQSCCSIERLYIHEKIYDEFMDHFVGGVRKLKVGDPMDPETTQGAITLPQQLTLFEKMIDDALAKGAKVEIGGKKVEGKGRFFEPTVLTNIDHTMLLQKDEIFGPIIGVMKVSQDDEAIELMNDSDFGLGASVLSSNRDRAQSILSEVDSCSRYINCSDRVSAYLPWAGRKNSGLGTTLSPLGLYAFCKPRGFHIKEL